MTAAELSLVLWKIDPMGTGCPATEDMKDEYDGQAQAIIDLLESGEDHRTALIRVFDDWFWEGCLLSESRKIALENILTSFK